MLTNALLKLTTDAYDLYRTAVNTVAILIDSVSHIPILIFGLFVVRLMTSQISIQDMQNCSIF